MSQRNNNSQQDDDADVKFKLSEDKTIMWVQVKRSTPMTIDDGIIELEIWMHNAGIAIDERYTLNPTFH